MHEVMREVWTVDGERTVNEVASDLQHYVNMVAREGERITIVQDGRRVAELVPATGVKHLRDLPGILASLPPLPEEDLDAFEADLEAARESLSGMPLTNPWES
jgi:antitoxin (DNA-binding transcriptional repressor) of toxin-antitoxin stability system